jgi:septal ring factor EnvC (AmiA/AmiB activator)
MHSCCFQSASYLTIAAAALSRLRAENEAAQRTLQQREQELTTLRAEKDAVQQQRDTARAEKDAIQQQRDTDVRQYEQRLSTLRREQDAALRSLQQQREKDLAAARAEKEAALRDIRREHDAAMSTLRAEKDAQLHQAKALLELSFSRVTLTSTAPVLPWESKLAALPCSTSKRQGWYLAFFTC